MVKLKGLFSKKNKGNSSADKGSKSGSQQQVQEAPQSNIFGKPLPKDPNDLPYFILEAMEIILDKGLDCEGIFRIAADKKIIDAVIEALEKDDRVELSNYDLHVTAAILKKYFRELPEPLLTFDHYDMFLAAEGIPDEEIRLDQIKKVLKFLPPSNFDIIKHLCSFLDKIQQNSKKNLMGSGNLAIVFAPNLLKSKLECTPQEAMKESKHSNSLMTTLIEESDFLFLDGKKSKDKKEQMEMEEKQKKEKQMLNIFDVNALDDDNEANAHRNSTQVYTTTPVTSSSTTTTSSPSVSAVRTLGSEDNNNNNIFTPSSQDDLSDLSNKIRRISRVRRGVKSSALNYNELASENRRATLVVSPKVNIDSTLTSVSQVSVHTVSSTPQTTTDQSVEKIESKFQHLSVSPSTTHTPQSRAAPSTTSNQNPKKRFMSKFDVLNKFTSAFKTNNKKQRTYKY